MNKRVSGAPDVVKADGLLSSSGEPGVDRTGVSDFRAYGSNSEVIRSVLRDWLEHERCLAALDAAISRGIADADAGRVHELDAVRAELGERFRHKAPL